MIVIIRAFNKDGYYKDILEVTERQVWNQDARVGEPKGSLMTGLIGWGGSIDPTDFPEMVRFEVVLKREK